MAAGVPGLGPRHSFSQLLAVNSPSPPHTHTYTSSGIALRRRRLPCPRLCPHPRDSLSSLANLRVKCHPLISVQKNSEGPMPAPERGWDRSRPLCTCFAVPLLPLPNPVAFTPLQVVFPRAPLCANLHVSQFPRDSVLKRQPWA